MAKNAVLHSALAPEALRGALQTSIDEEVWSFFSFSGYKGDRPVIAGITDDTFRLHWRRYFWRNDFAPNLYGKFAAEAAGGSRIEIHFDLLPSTKWFMRAWLGLVILIGVPLWIALLVSRLKHQSNASEDW